MSFTAKELDEVVGNLGNETVYDADYNSVPNPNYNAEYDDGRVWLNIYYGEFTELDTPLGKVGRVKAWGGEGDGATTYVVVKVGDRLFEKVGYHSSWGESEMDSDLVEVEAYVEPTTYYRKKS